MFVVQAVDGRRRWISGVFGSRAVAEEYLALIPQDHRPKHTVTDLGPLTYPLYVCEDDQGFRFLTEIEAIAELKRYARDLRQEDEDWCHVNLYRIPADWQPLQPGTDYMGALPHHHVNNFILECVERNGFESLWPSCPSASDAP